MFKKTALVAGIGLALSVTAQADYQWELGGDYTYGEVSADVKNNDFSNIYSTWITSEYNCCAVGCNKLFKYLGCRFYRRYIRLCAISRNIPSWQPKYWLCK